ncbi:MAG TPA: universal stress protein [Pseudonocardiaceae bacterium]|jgi:nucleotide-binding universal stress UspA family protein|nr:universal stress protein [Pseudonocardiaceae bacterium]
MPDATPTPRSQEPATAGVVTRPILVGYDGSAPSRHALAYAAGMARRVAQPLVLVHVRPTPACYSIDYGFSPPAEDPAELLDWLRAELAATIDTSGLTVQLVQRCGDAARQLAELADDTQADAIVLGAPARWVHRIAGSVPVWLTRHARCPVVIVP